MRLEYINSELPYLHKKKYSPYAAPEVAIYYEMFSKEQDYILKELTTL